MKVDPVDELKKAQFEIRQLIKGTMHFVTGKAPEKPFDGFHMSACAMRAGAMVDFALQAIELPPEIEWNAALEAAAKLADERTGTASPYPANWYMEQLAALIRGLKKSSPAHDPEAK